ncbi:hypothetical protein LGK97_12140 [Clostridium sp. CS001]|uniref:hypothetical protein n=1 Tax=Clostridium sp. CS001 TaxID=2880648 RepID=UPI001CF2D38E|nr:hypothetical protein [Clostridium sp. CS001]MCB2290517.1 hypothetical protein [Clostridium sp. CS001]
MVKRKLYQRLLVLGIVGSITISSAIVAFADNVKANNSTKTKIEGRLGVKHRSGDIQKGGMQKSNYLGTVLATQVTAGVITKIEADKVTEFLKAKEATRKAEMDAQKAKFDAMTDADKKVAMEAKKAERDAQKAKLKAMTVEERTAYMKANRPSNTNIFTELVTAGILTKDQADKIQAAAPQKPEKGREYIRQ